MPTPPPRKSGQAIIFLMVVLVIGILAVVWNFDLHRVVSAKLRMRNAGDAAAMAGARWQGHTLNMIGDLNLIQVAILSEAYALYDQEYQAWLAAGGDESDEPEPVFEDYYDPAEMETLHELRLRLELVGPLGAFAVAQQTAFNNGAMHDPALADNLLMLASDLREEIAETPYDNAWEEYADLLEDLAVRGVCVGSYALMLPQRPHPLLSEGFYGAIAQALADWWCPMYSYRYYLENYEDFESWPKFPSKFRYRLMFDLQLDEFEVEILDDTISIPESAMLDGEEYLDQLEGYLTNQTDVIDEDFTDYVTNAVFEADLAYWHVYHRETWTRPWPRPAKYNDETDLSKPRPLFAIRDSVKPKFNYLGAVAGISMSAPVSRGILSSSKNQTVDLSYKAKAKPFGLLNTEEGIEPPHYFGFVFPCFDDVRLIHSDIGQKVMSGEFYEHASRHVRPYLENGPSALHPDCPYCRLLNAWENLDRQAGLEWIDRAYSDDDDNPCDPEIDNDDLPWGDAGGGATGGS
ncbi:hypothetical protein PDESU_05695 [Pontiella desulfatans]|uniref:Uncharacterized protein n=1 Tax=Pontiella desulfatans TaxID=2750659 RepID=A0A6C2UAM1_PONDE|nr:pilus assembly protein TadG-related protein [Pontiella desulfatans]VGO17100.1 hypothetical protein PDESU_05695 [Pontiella desulfatans]